MKRSELMLMVLHVPLDFFLLLLAAVSAYYLRFSAWAVALKPVIFNLSLLDFIGLVTPVALGWLIIFAFAGLYSTDPNRKLTRDLNRVIFAVSAGLSAVALAIMFRQQLFDSRFIAAASWGFAIIYVCAGRVLMRGLKALLYRHGIGTRRIVIIGHHGAAEEIVKTIRARPELGYEILGQYVHFHDDTKAELRQKRPDELIFTNPRAHEAETLEAIEFCNTHHVTFKYSADLFDTFSTSMTVHPLAGIPIVELKRAPLEGWGRVVKRGCDIVFSLLALLVFLPVMLLTAVIILLETGRPVIYKNTRVGLRGEPFFAYKFRSMYQKDCTGEQFGLQGVHAEKKEEQLIQTNNSRRGPIYKIANDPRATPFGRFLRRWSIDEAPQFWNVLLGAMSVVGPRPHQPREVKQYTSEHRHVLTIKPGITGIAQISGRSDLSYDEEVRLDVFYIEKWSLWLDIVICLKTPFVIFRKRRAL